MLQKGPHWIPALSWKDKFCDSVAVVVRWKEITSLAYYKPTIVFMLKSFYGKLIDKPAYLATVLLLVVIGVTAQCILLGDQADAHGMYYAYYKNYLIFKHSFFHLLKNQNLYLLYTDFDLDYFKYSPSFAVLMAPMSVMPDFLGLLCWNLLNVFVLFFGIYQLPQIYNKQKFFVVAFVLIELITSLQNSQSNGLMAGLIVLAFAMCEKEKIAMATLCIVLSVFIKIFGLVGFALFLLYPNKIKAILYTIGWTILLILLPLLVNTPTQLYQQYQNWLVLLRDDYSVSQGISVGGILYTWFGISAKQIVFVVGAVLFCLPLLRFRFYKETRFQLSLLASILIWMVIFNHKAESPTFVIAVAGLAIWYISQPATLVNKILIVFAFLLTVLSATDIFPAAIRKNYVIPYDLKALPCVLIWCKLIIDMVFYTPKSPQIKAA